MNGDQYVLNVWSMKTGTPELIPFEDQIYLEAAIIGVSDNSLQLESTQNVLGSYSAIRAYALHDDVLTPLGDAWQIVPANTSYSRPVRCAGYSRHAGRRHGVRLRPRHGFAGHGNGRQELRRRDHKRRRDRTHRNRAARGDWQWYIDGESELEYFELVPYVG